VRVGTASVSKAARSPDSSRASSGSLGLLYTKLVRERAAIFVPNSAVLGSAVARRREPEPVEVQVHVRPDMRPRTLQRPSRTRSAP
jgi:hypothetical protein